MAKRRDSTTRSTARYERNINERSSRRYQSPVRNEYLPKSTWANYKGRRGVRARARMARIAQASQPSGGTITNS